jgi:hypothetical protein
MERPSPVRVTVLVLRGVLSAIGFALQAVGGVLDQSAPRTAGHSPLKSGPSEIDEDGYVVREGSTDLK